MSVWRRSFLWRWLLSLLTFGQNVIQCPNCHACVSAKAFCDTSLASQRPRLHHLPVLHSDANSFPGFLRCNFTQAASRQEELQQKMGWVWQYLLLVYGLPIIPVAHWFYYFNHAHWEFRHWLQISYWGNSSWRESWYLYITLYCVCCCYFLGGGGLFYFILTVILLKTTRASQTCRKDLKPLLLKARFLHLYAHSNWLYFIFPYSSTPPPSSTHTHARARTRTHVPQWAEAAWNRRV